MRGSGTRAAILAALATLLLAPPALAAKTWSGPKTLTDRGTTIDSPRVAMNGRDHAVVAWHVLDGETGEVTALQAVTRGRRGGFGDAVTLGPASDAGDDLPPTFPDVAIDQRGNMLIAWVMRDGAGTPTVVSSFRPRRGEFSPPQPLSAPGEGSSSPDLAFDKRGRAIAVWSRLQGTSAIVQAALRPRHGEFGDPVAISPQGFGSIFPSVGMSDDGAAVAAWLAQESSPPFTQYAQASAMPKGSAFGPAQTLSDPQLDADNPELAV